MRVRLLAGISVLLFAAWAGGQVTEPPGLAEGDSYRLIFTTSSRVGTPTNRTNHEEFDAITSTFVNLLVDESPGLASLATEWTPVTSTASIDARDRTNTNPLNEPGVPIYNLDGTLFAKDNHFWKIDDLPIEKAKNVAMNEVGSPIPRLVYFDTAGGVFRINDDPRYMVHGTNSDGTYALPLEDEPASGLLGEPPSGDWFEYGYKTGGFLMAISDTILATGKSQDMPLSVTQPPGLANGEEYRLIFASGSVFVYPGSQAEISRKEWFFELFSDAAAWQNDSFSQLETDWTVVASSDERHAMDRTQTNPAVDDDIPIYTLDGKLFSADNSFWFKDPVDINVNAFGRPLTNPIDYHTLEIDEIPIDPLGRDYELRRGYHPYLISDVLTATVVPEPTQLGVASICIFVAVCRHRRRTNLVAQCWPSKAYETKPNHPKPSEELRRYASR